MYYIHFLQNILKKNALSSFLHLQLYKFAVNQFNNAKFK